jgi:outer membrane immunogenic protein
VKKLLISSIAALGLIGTPAFAADMAVKASPPPPPPPVYSWTGFYAGLNAGWSWGKENATVNFPGPALPSQVAETFTLVGNGITVFTQSLFQNASIAYQETTHPIGAIGGVQGGYNWQAASNWILGIEADFQASGENASGNTHQNSQTPDTFVFDFGSPNMVSGMINISQSISQNESLLWFGTVRGRVGYAIWPTMMLYGTGGLAYGRLNESVSASSNFSVPITNTGAAAVSVVATSSTGAVVPLPFSTNQTFEAAVTKTGWTLGGGIEGVVPNTHVTWKAEYLYMDLGTENYTFSTSSLGAITVNTHFTDNIVRVGLNYQFH